MNVVLILTISLIACYAVFVFLQVYGWLRTKRFDVPEDYMPSVRVSVIIPARNEALNIPVLLEGLLQQDYPQHLLEIILVDDNSTDTTLEIAQRYAPRVKILSAEKEERLHKKRALEQGIAAASGELIVTTDADCTHPVQWVRTVTAYYETHRPKLMLAPVVFRSGNTLSEHFQQLEFSALMLTTAASAKFKNPLMANGANLSYPKKIFDEVNGYSGDTISSGDDISLLQKVRKKYGSDAVRFIRSEAACVQTEPVTGWKTLLSQRTRWASKNFIQKDLRSLITGGFVLLYALAMFFSLALPFFYPVWFYVPLSLFLFKTVADSWIFFTGARFSGKRNSLYFILLAELIYLPYLFAVMIRSIGGRYEWKGRTVHR